MPQKSKTRKWFENLTGGPLTLAKVLHARRQTETLTQTEMANILGISKQTLSNIEKDRKYVNPGLAAEFARKLGASEKQFIRLTLQDELRRNRLPYDVSLEPSN